MGNFIWGRVYGLGKIGRGKVYDSLQEYSPLSFSLEVSILIATGPKPNVNNPYSGSVTHYFQVCGEVSPIKSTRYAPG